MKRESFVLDMGDEGLNVLFERIGRERLDLGAEVTKLIETAMSDDELAKDAIKSRTPHMTMVKSDTRSEGTGCCLNFTVIRAPARATRDANHAGLDAATGAIPREYVPAVVDVSRVAEVRECTSLSIEGTTYDAQRTFLRGVTPVPHLTTVLFAGRCYNDCVHFYLSGCVLTPNFVERMSCSPSRSIDIYQCLIVAPTVLVASTQLSEASLMLSFYDEGDFTLDMGNVGEMSELRVDLTDLVAHDYVLGGSGAMRNTGSPVVVRWSSVSRFMLTNFENTCVHRLELRLRSETLYELVNCGYNNKNHPLVRLHVRDVAIYSTTGALLSLDLVPTRNMINASNFSIDHLHGLLQAQRSERQYSVLSVLDRGSAERMFVALAHQQTRRERGCIVLDARMAVALDILAPSKPLGDVPEENNLVQYPSHTAKGRRCLSGPFGRATTIGAYQGAIDHGSVMEWYPALVVQVDDDADPSSRPLGKCEPASVSASAARAGYYRYTYVCRYARRDESMRLLRKSIAPEKDDDGKEVDNVGCSQVFDYWLPDTASPGAWGVMWYIYPPPVVDLFIPRSVRLDHSKGGKKLALIIQKWGESVRGEPGSSGSWWRPW